MRWKGRWREQMKRVYIKFTFDDHMNIEGDYIVHDGEFIYVYNGDNVVAIVRPEIVNLICISEKQGREKHN
jgi:hypothetical protein